jgi:hypothetical protein
MTYGELIQGFERRHDSYEKKIKDLKEFLNTGEIITDPRGLKGFVDIIILDIIDDYNYYTRVLNTVKPMPETWKVAIRDFLRCLSEFQHSFNTYVNIYTRGIV